MKARGMGMVYRRGQVWWVKISFRGVPHRESSHSPVRSDAVKLLRRRQAEMGQGRLGNDFERVTFEDLARLVVDDYTMNGRKSLPRAKQALAHLRERFRLHRAVDITSASATSYIKLRLGAGAAPATVRHEVSFLARAFNLAYRAGMAPARPPFPTIQVRNTRKGFFEESELHAVLSHLPRYLRPFVECAYLTGWRRTELRTLTWRQVDFGAGTLRLEPGETKNDEGRVFPFDALPRLAELLSVVTLFDGDWVTQFEGWPEPVGRRTL